MNSNRRVLAVVGLSVLLALSGCSGLFQSPNPNTPTATPQNGPAPGDDPHPGQFPNGVSQSGIEVQPLMQSHVGTLANNSFTANLTLTGPSPDSNGTVIQTRLIQVAGDKKYVETSAQGIDSPTRKVYTDGGPVYIQTTGESQSEPQYNKQNTSVPIPRLVDSRTIGSHIAGANFSFVENRTVNGQTVHVFTADSLDRPVIVRSPINGTTAQDYQAELVISANGHIKSLDVTMTARNGDEHRLLFTLSNVGSTSIEEPGWVSDAEEQSTDLTFSMTDSNYGKLTVASGNGIPEGAAVIVQGVSSGFAGQTNLTSAVETGESIYLSVTSDSQLQATQTEPSDAFELPVTRGSIAVVDEDGRVVDVVRYSP